MASLEHYQALLTKLASADVAEAVSAEHKDNLGDSRNTLNGLFDEARSTSSKDTALINKLLPAKPKTDVETSNPLLKVAFVSAAGELPFCKTAAPHYLSAMFLGFSNELDKIAAALAAPTSVSQVQKEMSGFQSLAGGGPFLNRAKLVGAVKKLPTMALR